MSEQQSEERIEERKPGGRRRVIVPIVILLIAAGILVYWLLSRGKVSTDDAQVQGDLVPISPRVSGYVDLVAVRDNEAVDVGRLLVQMNTRDLQAALKKAEADLAAARAQAAAASGQAAITEQTAPAGESQASAAVDIARSGVTVAERQVRFAQAQYSTAQAGVDAASDAVAGAASDVESASAQVESAQANLAQSRANVTAAEARSKRTTADLARARQLYEEGATSKQQLDAAEEAATSAQAALAAAQSAVESAQAAVTQARARRSAANAALAQSRSRLKAAQASAEQARAGVGAAQAAVSEARGQLARSQAVLSGAQTVPEQMTVSRQQQAAARARVEQLEADVRAARLRLSYTTIKAPVDGVVSQKTVQKGQYVQPGQMLMALVPLARTWVVANFKETDLRHIQKGARAMIEVDTYPGRPLRGVVQSIGAATGSKFSLLPPENATGNFVKVVQRVPVKIVFHRPLPSGMVLRPGMNVQATVFF